VTISFFLRALKRLNACFSVQLYLTLISPVFTYILLVHISGVRMLEDMGNKKWGHLEEYKNYKDKTPRIIPKF